MEEQGFFSFKETSHKVIVHYKEKKGHINQMIKVNIINNGTKQDWCHLKGCKEKQLESLLGYSCTR